MDLEPLPVYACLYVDGSHTEHYMAVLEEESHRQNQLIGTPFHVLILSQATRLAQRMNRL